MASLGGLVTRALAVGLLLTGCVADDAQAPGDAVTPDDLAATVADVALDCEALGHGCTFAEVDAAVVDRSDTLAVDAADRLAAGASIEEAAGWVREQDGVVEVVAGVAAFRFRLEGGRGTWVLGAGALATRGGGSPPTAVAGGVPLAAAGPLPGLGAAPLGAVAGGDGEDDRRALVLSPMFSEFRPYDEGAEVADLLAGTRGYAEARYRHNAERLDTDVDHTDFLGWEDYDVVHVATHGVTVCDPVRAGPCRGVVASHRVTLPVEGDEGVISSLRLAELLDVRGVELAVSERDRGLELTGPERVVLLTADFFRAAYPAGLDDTIVYISACESMAVDGTDIVEALRGETSLVLGWDTTVKSDVARAASIALYEDLRDRGVTVDEALAAIGTLRTDRVGGQLLSSGRRVGGDLRLRQVVTVLDPVSSCPMEEVDAVVPLEGVFGDGEPDVAPWLVRVEGIHEEQAADALVHVQVLSEITVRAHVEVGSLPPEASMIEPVPLSAGTMVADGVWELSGTVPLVDDVIGGNEFQFITAWVVLPEGGRSIETSAFAPQDADISSVSEVAPCGPAGEVEDRELAATDFDPDVPLRITYRYLVGGRVTDMLVVSWRDGNIAKLYTDTDLLGTASSRADWRWVRGPDVDDGYCDLTSDNGCSRLGGSRVSSGRNAFLPGVFGEIPAYEGVLPALRVTGSREVAGVTATCGAAVDELFGEVVLCVDEATGGVVYVHTVGRCAEVAMSCVEVEAIAVEPPDDRDFQIPLP